MTDSVKCLGFNELLKKAKTLCELAWDCSVCTYQSKKACKHKFRNTKWVSVDVLKEFSLSVASKEDSLRKLWEEKAFCKKWLDNEPEPCPINSYKKCLDTNKPCKKAELVIFLKDVLQVFDKTFSEKGSLQEKKESDKP